MEYQTPSMFDENGFNMLSPNAHMFRPEGNPPSGQSSFVYNGDSPQQTAMNNNLNPYQYNGYYQSQNQYPMVDGTNPPPGFIPMNPPVYGGYQQQQQPYNPYTTLLMQQGNDNNGYAYNYQPNQSMYDPYTYPQQNNQMTVDQIADYGHRMKTMLQDAMNPQVQQQSMQQPYQYDDMQPIIKYDAYGRPIGEYSYQEIKEMNAPIYNQLYRSGAMSLSEYCTMNNGGISFIDTHGRTVRLNTNDNWYGSSRIQQQQRAYQEYQQLYNENMTAWQICININRNYMKSEYGEQYVQQIDEEAEYNRKKQERINQYRESERQDEYRYNCLCAVVNSMKRSTDKGYVTPYLEQYIKNWNTNYNRVVEKYSDSYDFNDYLNKGILENQIIDEMEYEAKQRERRVDLMFSKQKCQNLFGQMFPTYDPVTGTSCAPVSMGVSDLEIKLPEHLKRDRYLNRKYKFTNTIFSNNQQALPATS